LTLDNNGRSIRVPVILGPTAVGKTELAVGLCRDLGLELLSCDSRQIYRFMDIGTAKPTALQQRLVKHWMIDTADPDEGFSCYRFAAEAMEIIRRRAQSGRRVLVCGGSGLYFHSLSKGLGPAVAPQKEFRETYFEKARCEGNQSIFDELARIDPCAAAATHPSNLQRNIRALEVYYHSGKTLSELKGRSRPPEGVDFFVLECALPREVLYRRINERVDVMVKSGLLEEFHALRKRGYDHRCPGMQCVGYKELFAVEKSPNALPDAIDAVKMNTRHYAKRQITWLRHQVKCREIPMDKLDLGSVKKMVEEYIA